MPAVHFTDAFVRTLKLPKKEDRPNQVSYFDRVERGLSVELVASFGGAKTWRVVTYTNGISRSKKLGSYPSMSVKQAREAARQYWLDPAKFDGEKQVATFGLAAATWMERYVKANGLRSEREIARQLDRYILPHWRTRKLSELGRREVNTLLDEISDQHGKAQADSVLALIRSLFNWYQARDEHFTSPIVKGMKRGTAQSRKRILSDDELRRVWSATEGPGQFNAIVRLSLLSGQRRQKIAALRHADIVGDTWTIATDEREKGNGAVLQLPPIAMQLIAEQPRLDQNPFVFFGSLRGRRRRSAAETREPPCFNAWSQRMDELRAKLGSMDRWTPHDLRRTARSLMSRAGVRPDIAERVLGHKLQGVEAVYDRHQYLEEKATALIRLADLIQSIVNPQPTTNVIKMHTAA